jgi:hypothetical protein
MTVAEKLLNGEIALAGRIGDGSSFETTDSELAEAVWDVINGKAMIVSRDGVIYWPVDFQPR